MLNNYSIIYRDLEFEGLKFRHSKSYGEGEFDSLLDEGSQYSEIRCQKGLDREALERIHICLSYGGLLKVLAFTLIGFAFMLAPVSVLWGSVLLATVSLILFIISILFKRKAARDYNMRETVSSLIEVIFEERREKAGGADDKSSKAGAG